MTDDRASRANTRAGDALAELRHEEANAALVEETAQKLRASSRQLLGVSGQAEPVASLRETFNAGGVGFYPAIALGLLVAVDQLGTQAMTILGPEISGTLGISRTSYSLVLLLKTFIVFAAALPTAALVQRRPWRGVVSVSTAFLWSILTAMTAFVVSFWGLLLVAVAAGAATASARSIHQPLLLDSYPTDSRVRVLSFYRGFDSFGEILGPVLVGVCAIGLDLTWRGVFLGMGLTALVATLTSVRLSDPGFGRWDTEEIRLRVRPSAAGDLEQDAVPLRFFEIARRVMLVPTVRRILIAFAVQGMLLVPFLTYVAFLLQERFGLGPGARAAFMAGTPLFGIVGLRLFGSAGEKMFRVDPARLLRLSGLLMAAGLVMISVGVFLPTIALTFICFGGGLGVITVMFPAMSLPMYSVVPANMRPHLGALQGMFASGVGGIAGLILLSGVDQRFGASGAIVSLVIPGAVAGYLLYHAAETVNADIDRMVDAIVEEEEVRALVERGERLPMLACRNLSFAYGQLQVLFDVNFTVDDGEIVALLGTNGAGKSTLLRSIAGLGMPTGGSIRFRGADITYIDAERRVGLGISQVPGGRAVFGGMSVIENMRMFGYAHGANRRLVEQGIEDSFAAFPVLAERRNQPAATLSGGEQQMLGLSTAFIMRPRLLLIDELSLGLAPAVVGELLEMVRMINAAGTAVVLIEQSVNVALSVVDHAYFMERGQIRFDGVAADLVGRDDLLRSVFLEGAERAIATATLANR